MLRKSKKFERPRKLFNKPRILEENKLVTKYGLKNKKEIWKAEAKIKEYRNRAKSLITSEPEEQQKFFVKLNKVGLKVETVADVLALNKEDVLKRRLPSVMVKKNLATKPKQARQMVTHKRVLVNGRIVNVPSYIVKVSEENSIALKKKTPKAKPVVEGASKVDENSGTEATPENTENVEEVKNE